MLDDDHKRCIQICLRTPAKPEMPAMNIEFEMIVRSLAGVIHNRKKAAKRCYKRGGTQLDGIIS